MNQSDLIIHIKRLDDIIESLKQIPKNREDNENMNKYVFPPLHQAVGNMRVRLRVISEREKGQRGEDHSLTK